MTVLELIRQLSKYPDDLPVVISVDEGGYAAVSSVSEIRIGRASLASRYRGEFDEASDGERAVKIRVG